MEPDTYYAACIEWQDGPLELIQFAMSFNVYDGLYVSDERIGTTPEDYDCSVVPIWDDCVMIDETRSGAVTRDVRHHIMFNGRSFWYGTHITYLICHPTHITTYTKTGNEDPVIIHTAERIVDFVPDTTPPMHLAREPYTQFRGNNPMFDWQDATTGWAKDLSSEDCYLHLYGKVFPRNVYCSIPNDMKCGRFHICCAVLSFTNRYAMLEKSYNPEHNIKTVFIYYDDI